MRSAHSQPCLCFALATTLELSLGPKNLASRSRRPRVACLTLVGGKNAVFGRRVGRHGACGGVRATHRLNIYTNPLEWCTNLTYGELSHRLVHTRTSLIHAKCTFSRSTPRDHRVPPYGRRAPLPLAPGRAPHRRQRTRRRPGSRAAPAAAAAFAAVQLATDGHSREEHVDADEKRIAQREDGGVAACGRGMGR